MPQFVALQLHADVKLVQTDYCLFGVPWRKRTKFLYCHVDLGDIACKCASRQGRCDRTGLPHIQLAGAQDGVMRTKLAEPYPPKLCRKLARAFSAAICCQSCQAMQRLAGSRC